MKPLAKYVWLDLETTGTKPEAHRILECYALATDGTLAPADGPTVHAVLHCLGPSEAADAVVADMHRTNGLWDECARSATLPEDLDAALVAMIESYEWALGKPYLAGATVHFDRGFLERWCPRAIALFGHRHLDVSSLKLMMGDVAGAPFAKANAHRAKADVEESLEQAREIYALVMAATPRTT